MTPGTCCCRASVMFSESVRAISLVSTMLTLAGTLSGSMPEPAMGVVGYTTTVGGLRTTRDAFWERPGLALVGVGDTTTGGKVSTGPGASWARAQSCPGSRHSGIDTINRNRTPICLIPTPAVLVRAGSVDDTSVPTRLPTYKTSRFKVGL